MTECLQCAICYAMNTIWINKDLIDQVLGQYLLRHHCIFLPVTNSSPEVRVAIGLDSLTMKKEETTEGVIKPGK